ncbi:unnamed protein product [Caenorhabditis bovis]|uniref:EF-hand domain-containing protein n=1 Tax=Caenorhabditis bovis TaxID=2654633 RepID=A0A8S1EYQ9_9PELO|nr:unnamed protein product [Caenorhabditis bovis]
MRLLFILAIFGKLSTMPIEPIVAPMTELVAPQQQQQRRHITNSVEPLIDANGDGELDIDEVRYAAFVHHGLSASVVEGMFKQVDANRDGVLDAREFDAIRPLVLEKAENAALRYLQNVDTDRDGLLSLSEAQAYLLREYGIGNRDVTRLWKLVTPNVADRLNATMFSRLRRRVRGMTIRLARQIMKAGDLNGDGHISVDEAQAIAFEQEGIGAGDVASMVGSVDENMDGELNAPEFADFERIVRARALENSKKAMRVVDADNSGTLTLDEAKKVAFEHYGFDEATLAPFFAQADENEDGQLDIVEFAGFRTVIRQRSVKDATTKLESIDTNADGLVSVDEAIEMTKREDDMADEETIALFNIADQNKSGKLDKVELADFNRLVRLSSIKFAADHFKEFDLDGNDVVTFEELALLIEQKYGIPENIIKGFFERIDVDASGNLDPAEIVDFRHLIRNHVTQNKKPEPTTTTITTITATTTIGTTAPVTSSTPAPVRVTEAAIIDGIANDVIAQDIAAPSTKHRVTTTTPATTTTSTTTTTIFTATVAPSTVAIESTVTRKRNGKSTTTAGSIATSTTPKQEVVIEEIVYEDENGNPMTPKMRKNEDVSYEEVIEYVDEPAAATTSP